MPYLCTTLWAIARIWCIGNASNWCTCLVSMRYNLSVFRFFLIYATRKMGSSTSRPVTHYMQVCSNHLLIRTTHADRTVLSLTIPEEGIVTHTSTTWKSIKLSQMDVAIGTIVVPLSQLNEPWPLVNQKMDL